MARLPAIPRDVDAALQVLSRRKAADERLTSAARRLAEANEALHVAKLEHRLASEAVEKCSPSSDEGSDDTEVKHGS
jgi:hypothetical protein